MWEKVCVCIYDNKILIVIVCNFIFIKIFYYVNIISFIDMW